MKNTKLTLIGFFCALALSMSAQQKSGATPYWLDPAQNRINVEAPRSDFFAFESIAKAESGDKARSERYISLEGTWKFHFSKNHNEAPAGFYAPKFDDSAWDNFKVPGLLELNGYGDPIYKNIGYAWATQFDNNPPYVEEKNNYTGSYRKSVRIPADWKGMDIYLHVGSATSNLSVWANGDFVGYSEDSKSAAEFNLTKYLKTGADNVLALQVMRWCDGSYLEDQDFWRFTGLAREVYLYARPKTHIVDLRIGSDLANGWKDGLLSVDVQTVNSKSETLDITLEDAQGKVVYQQNLAARAWQ